MLKTLKFLIPLSIVGIYLTSWGLNDGVKLTKIWTTGPSSLFLFVQLVCLKLSVFNAVYTFMVCPFILELW